ncbi:MAG: dienelactone hydrolase family protein [Caldilineaceae bacterium]|nr:dienelactone hydrolase family protein [Caldilineaceae bacterium]MCB0098677.1 dienelactone hydrolase family protein [Caldilineaceae bacterium]
MMSTALSTHPHGNQPLYHWGKPATEASTAMILLHGRGATAESILSLAPAFERPNLAYVAPQAAGDSWYPYRFVEPVARNEPYLSSALQRIDEVVADLNDKGIAAAQIILGGFSQGACLAAEYTARHAQRWGGLLVFSGGLIGPPGAEFNFGGSLKGTPVFIGCSDTDFHIPLMRVHETTRVLTDLGAKVTERIYPDMGHTIIEDEIEQAQAIIDQLDHY